MILLDTGDALVGGGLLGDKTQGQAIVMGMGLMGYDAMALGPKELALGQAVLQLRIAEATQQGLAVLSANAYYPGTDDLVAPSHTVVEAGGRKIGVIGLTRLPDAADEVTEFEVRDPLPALERAVGELAQVDTIFLLTNLEHYGAATLSMAVPGISLAIAARPDVVPDNYMLAPETLAIVVVADKVEHDRVHGAFRGRRVGTLDVELQADGNLVNPVWTSVPMTYHYKNDPTMVQLLEMFK